MKNGEQRTENGARQKIGWILCLWFVFCLLWSGCTSAENISQICFEQKCLTIEIADEPEEWQRGLMFRESMLQDHGMLFVFDKDDYYSFWMKNTLIPLDMIWLDEKFKVVHIEQNVPPCKSDWCPSYHSPDLARYVLELNAGAVKKIGLSMDDQMILK